MKKKFTIIALAFSFSLSAQQITEIHYDNTGTDANERVEITFPTGTNITGWTLVLYNGTGGVTYDTKTIASGTLTTESGFDIYVISYPSNGIQNGAPDALALADGSNALVEFLSYEGTFAATNGPANGITSTSIVASEDGTGSSTGSIQKNSTTGLWSTNPSSNSFGALNNLLLPLQLSSFEAIHKQNNITLSWVISSSTDIVNYEVEKSTDGISFTKISTVPSQQTNIYSFVDYDYTTGTFYYRLKINETNGSFYYSLVQKVKITGKGLFVNNIYPTPTKNNLTLDINSSSTSITTIEVLDLNGKIVLSSSFKAIIGSNVKTFNTAQLKAGMYMVRVKNDTDMITEKIIKQ